KANPETGAADFVGAAVAMAVVSVAAAGALALKK
ncbi:MAG: NPXTG-anchored protein, partial [Oscillospiraceae bacterium]|nr:NPXTG-anchored protein [Oscillospiraceae bacterium]